jgi:hypothetical protein
MFVADLVNVVYVMCRLLIVDCLFSGFCSFSKLSGDISENGDRWWIAACKLGLWHAAIHLPLLFERG